jgi:hypothetical protein
VSARVPVLGRWTVVWKQAAGDRREVWKTRDDVVAPNRTHDVDIKLTDSQKQAIAGRRRR